MKNNTSDKVVKLAMLVFLAVGAILGYAQYISGATTWVARGAVAFVVALCIERLVTHK